MNILTSKIHGILDYLTSLFFLAAPTLFNLSETGTYLAYTLAVVHFLMTVLTGFSMGWIRVVPFTLHGNVELLVSIVLVVVPLLLPDFFGNTDRVLFSACGIAIFIVWLLTQYKSPIETGDSGSETDTNAGEFTA